MEGASRSKPRLRGPARRLFRRRAIVLVALAALLVIVGGVGATQVPAGLDRAARYEFGSAAITQERVGQDRAQALAAATPDGATVDATSNEVTFHTRRVRMTILAGPPGQEMTFRVGGLTNPTLEVPRGATVEVRLINGDAQKPHGWAVLTANASADEPLRGRAPAIPGAAAMLLDQATPSGWPAQTITFSTARRGHYAYLCQVGDHGRMGMRGTFEVVAG